MKISLNQKINIHHTTAASVSFCLPCFQSYVTLKDHGIDSTAPFLDLLSEQIFLHIQITPR